MRRQIQMMKFKVSVGVSNSDLKDERFLRVGERPQKAQNFCTVSAMMEIFLHKLAFITFYGDHFGDSLTLWPVES